MTPDTEYELRVRTYGYTDADCLGSGDEFNPLFEVNAFQMPNPY
jgi:hypothetical protein